jgi:hypothetical protein
MKHKAQYEVTAGYYGINGKKNHRVVITSTPSITLILDDSVLCVSPYEKVSEILTMQFMYTHVRRQFAGRYVIIIIHRVDHQRISDVKAQPARREKRALLVAEFEFA